MREQLSSVDGDARLGTGPPAQPNRRRGVRVTSAAVIALGLSLAGGAVAGATTSASTGTPSSSSTASGVPTGRPPMGGSPPAAFGTVKSVGDGSFTLTEQDGTVVTVNVGSTTSYLDPGVTSPSLANVTVGEHVAVFGTDTSDVIAATRVALGTPPAGGKGGPGGPGGRGGPPGMGGSPPAAFGTVKSVGDGTFTLTEQDGTVVTVNVGSTTSYVDPGVTSPSLANVTVGEHVAVFGTDSSDVVTATRVAIGTPPSGGPGGFGGKGGPPGMGTPPSTSSSASS
jgi:hypothetical protein